MADLDFTAADPFGNATITVLLPDGTVSRFTKLSTTVIGDKCPLLLYAFDDGPHGDNQASIEASSVALVTSFLRFLYTGYYLTCLEENGPCSLLRHAEIYKMAQDYDVPELQVSAHVNFLRETELSCCVPNPPIDLCEAIQFVYKHLASQQPLVDTLLNYCVSSFKYHRLADNAQFRQIAYDTPEFHRQLCQTSYKREFQDDGASEIMRLPVCRSNPCSVALFSTDLQVDKRTHAEFQFQEWYDSETHSSEADSERGSSSATRGRVIKKQKTIPEHRNTLVHRSKVAKTVDAFSESEQSSDDDGFTLVHRPKSKSALTIVAEDVPSSPEAISLVSSDTDATLVSFPDASDDEAHSDWSLL